MTNRPSLGAIAFTALFAAVLLFFHLGSVPLLDPDEPVYAETPKEMIQHQEYVSPRIYGEYWYDKPPMYYWLVAGAFKAFGTSDFAARFPSALAGVLCVASVHFFAGKLLGARAGLASALVLATSIEFVYLGKAAVTDMTLLLFLTLSLFCFIDRKYLLFFLFSGLAVLTKGPIGLFPVVIAFFHLLLTRNLSEAGRMKLPFGIVLFCLAALPWYIAMYKLHGGAFVDTFLGFHNVTRFASPEHPSGRLWYYYLPVLLIGFFPWIAALPQAVMHAFSSAREKGETLFFFLLWALLVFGFFTVAQTKLVSYILPMYPALAVIVGWYVDRLWDEWDMRRRKRQTLWLALTALLSGAFIYGGFLGLEAMPELESGVMAMGAIFGVMALVSAAFLWKKEIGAAFYAQVFGMLCFFLVLSAMLFPAAAPKFTAAPTVKAFEAVYDGKSPIYVSKFLRPGFAFYSDRYGEELIFSPSSVPDMQAIYQKSPQAFFVLRDIDYERIPEAQRQRLKTVKVVDNKMILKL